MAFSVIMNVVPVLEDKSLKDRENLCELSLPGDGPSGQVLVSQPGREPRAVSLQPITMSAALFLQPLSGQVDCHLPVR